MCGGGGGGELNIRRNYAVQISLKGLLCLKILGAHETTAC